MRSVLTTFDVAGSIAGVQLALGGPRDPIWATCSWYLMPCRSNCRQATQVLTRPFISIRQLLLQSGPNGVAAKSGSSMSVSSLELFDAHCHIQARCSAWWKCPRGLRCLSFCMSIV